MTAGGGLPRALGHHTAQHHAGFRSLQSMLPLLGGVSLLFALSLLEPIQRTLQVHQPDAGLAVGGFGALSVLAALALRWKGFDSRLYQVFNRLETVWTCVGTLALIYRSGSARSFFWAVFIGLLAQAGAYGGFIRFNVTLFVSSLVALAVGFAVTVGFADTVMVVLMGALSMVMYATMLRSTLQLNRALDARALQDTERRELEVLRERARIARDLHDGLGAQLTGLLYRVGNDTAEALEDRVRGCVDELRTTVWLMRETERAPEDVITWLRERCLDLCAGQRFVLVLEDALPPRLQGERWFHVVRMVLEAVRNSVRHAQAARIEVSMRFSPSLVVKVCDDGVGIPDERWQRSEGGLANLRSRAALTGARLMREAGRGTTLRFEW